MRMHSWLVRGAVVHGCGAALYHGRPHRLQVVGAEEVQLQRLAQQAAHEGRRGEAAAALLGRHHEELRALGLALRQVAEHARSLLLPGDDPNAMDLSKIMFRTLRGIGGGWLELAFEPGPLLLPEHIASMDD